MFAEGDRCDTALLFVGCHLMSHSFEYKNMQTDINKFVYGNKQNNNKLYFSDQEEEKMKGKQHEAQAEGESSYGEKQEETRLQENEERLQRLSDFNDERDDERDDDGEYVFNFIEGPRHKRQRNVLSQMPREKVKPACGCGHTPYSCNSALYLHIRLKHDGIMPAGTTIGYHKALDQGRETQADYRARILLEEKPKINRGEDEDYEPDQQGSEHSQGPPKSLYGKQQEKNFAKYQPAAKRKQVKEEFNFQSPHPEKFICPVCDLSYLSKCALNTHFTIKHVAKKKEEPQVDEPQENKKKQWKPFCCGCGKRYTTSSALRLHVKKKHNGYYIDGTCEEPTKRQLQIKEIQEHLRTQKNEPPPVKLEENIFDSESQYEGDSEQDDKSFKPKLEVKEEEKEGDQTTKMRIAKRPNLYLQQYRGKPTTQPLKLYQGYYLDKQNHRKGAKRGPKPKHKPNAPSKQKEGKQETNYCGGCNRPYSCSSALGLHVRSSHNGIAPQGTIGGPRTIYPLEQSSEREVLSCSICKKQEMESHFKCLTCPSHLMCTKCFWSDNYFSPEHEWVIKAKSQTD